MNPDEYQRARRLFLRANELDPAQRAAFLREQCPDRSDLREHVESLLRHAAQIDRDAPDWLEQPLPVPHPDRVGQFEILGVLGEGGMGVVYLARQDNPRRTVALKLLRAGFASPSAFRRLEYEAQLLGRLQHAGIAQVHAAGRADTIAGPQPYFAMEFVDGCTLAEHVAGLGLKDRLELFARICDAVHHAHQKGVLHCDLKPANVLVDRHGQPKVVDFGVARALDPDVRTTSVRSDVRTLAGTLAYMSPEQTLADRDDIDVRSDVYALGVICYELVTGRLPHDVTRLQLLEALRTIRDDEPPRAASLDRRFAGDLDTILRKALEKDRVRRYQSVSDLAADVRRYSNDEPISAHPPSTLYVLRKFAARNRVLVGGVAATFLALVAGVVATSSMLRRALAAERDAARTLAAERGEARAHQFLVDRLFTLDPMSQGGAASVPKMLEQAALEVDGVFAREPVVQARLHHGIGMAFLNLGHLDAAEREVQAAVDLHRSASGETDAATLASMNGLALVWERQGKLAEAEDMFRRVLALDTTDDDSALATAGNLAQVLRARGKASDALPLARAHHEHALARHGAAHRTTITAAVNLARIHEDLGDRDASGKLLEPAHRLAPTVLRPDDPIALALANSYGIWLMATGREGDALAVLEPALQLARTVWPDDHEMTLTMQTNLATLRYLSGDLAAAAKMQRDVLVVQERKLGPWHPASLTTMNNLAGTLMAMGSRDNLEEAERLLRSTIEHCAPDDPRVLTAMASLGGMLERLGKVDEAEQMLRSTLALQRQRLPADHPEPPTTLHNLGLLLRARGRLAEAEQCLRDAVASKTRVFGEGHRTTLMTMYAHALVLMDTKRAAEAEPVLATVLERAAHALPEGHWETACYMRSHGVALAALGRDEEAERELRQSVALLQGALSAEHPQTKSAIAMLVGFLESRQRAEEAAPFRSLLGSGR